jgi:integrase
LHVAIQFFFANQDLVARRMKTPRRNRGEGNIQQLPDGRFKVRMSYVDGQGKRHQPTAYFETKKAALAWLHEMHSKHDRGQLADAGRRTVGAWLAEWLTLKKSQIEPNTYAGHEQHIRLYLTPHLGRTPLAKLRSAHVATLYTELAGMGISPTTQKHAAVTLSAALNLAVKMGYLTSNPARNIAKPKAEPAEIHPLDVQQVRIFLAATAEDRLHALYVLALDGGMRQGELFGLHWPEVDFDTGVITVKQSLEERNGHHRLKKPKTKWSRRSFRVSTVTLDALNVHRQRQLAEGFYQADGAVFCNLRGGLIHKSNFYTHSFALAAKRAACRTCGFTI